MRSPLARFLFALAAAGLVRSGRAVPIEQIEALFRPFLAEQVTLSPDGLRVAYTEHAKDGLQVVIMKLEPPYAKIVVEVADDTPLEFSGEKKRATLRFLRWATADRLVFSPGEVVVRLIANTEAGMPGAKQIAPIEAIDADGKNPTVLGDTRDFVITIAPPDGSDAKDFPRRTRIIGLMDVERETLLVQAVGYESRVFMAENEDAGVPNRGELGRLPIPFPVPTTLFKINVRTGAKTPFADDYFYGTPIADRTGRAQLAYRVEPRSPVRTFAPLDPHAPKFDAALLGPLAKNFSVSTANYFDERAYPLGFDSDPAVLYVASNVGRDTFGIYAFNLQTRTRTALALEDPHRDLAPLEPVYPSPQLVFDEFRGKFAGVRSPGPRPVTVWVDPEIAAAQRTLEKKFPRRTVELLEWSKDRAAFLVRVTGGTEPGRYFVWRKKENLPFELFRRAPWLAAATLHPTDYFEFDTLAGVHLSGYVTRPLQPRRNPPPVLLCFASGFPADPVPEFDREAQVLASLGFVVLRLNHRGVGGFGIRHRAAVLDGIDRVPIDDALAALEWVAARQPIDRRRVATFGNGFGGYLALRALQLHPEAFRCGVAINAPLDLAFWLQPEVSIELAARFDFPLETNRAFLRRGPANLSALSVLAKPDNLTNPVCLIVDPTLAPSIASANTSLRARVRRQGGVADYFEVNADYAQELPKARARVYEHLEEFFNLNLYDYNVKIGPTKEVK